MRTALLFQKNNFVGREYYARLVAAGLRPDLVISVGRMKPESIAFERARTAGLWNPPEIPADLITQEFGSLSDEGVAQLLRRQAVDVAVQGGIGILKGDILTAPAIGFLNVHPGRLPQYRGNACPEWALLNGDQVVATAHLIDEGIDTGPVITSRAYEISPVWNYADFRAHLYEHCASVLVDALHLLARDGRAAAVPQSSDGAHYYPPLTPEQRVAVESRFPVITAEALTSP